ncbi:E3 ubiquitin-protein ligase FANCL isoform X2 [Anthonomus grandis grandis]|uniref:E3 ubiquitin-protein ligase FANCL isoform X2 n=1 Tax=Anthonomus grandis grandis TaxID=2921223 RepID=UPI002166B07D|nr:E3 ubiquitin-protein ligase FANCL isoform X2 [Anthonomus grandis grandis]
MDTSLELVLQYPLIKIKPTTEDNVLLLEGKFCVNNKDIFIKLKQTSLIDGQQKYELRRLDVPEKSQVQSILDNNCHKSIVEVLDSIQRLLKSKVQKQLPDYCIIYRTVLHEYSEFTKFFLNLKSCKLKEDLTVVYASATDNGSREHFVEILVDYSKKSSDIFKISECDLPLRDEDNFKPNNSLTALFDQFVAKIELLQPYFDLMEEFDKNSTVMDPENPKWKESYRRIWLGILNLHGPDRLVDPYNEALNGNLEKWVYQENIFQAILDLLGLQVFPKREISAKQVNLLVEYGECSICFSLRLNEKLPEIICTNKSCEQFYHDECLYNWLISLNAKRIFNNISGNCPNCEKTISCPVLDEGF